MPRGVRAGLAVLVLVALAPSPAHGQDVVPSPVPVATAATGERSRLADELETITATEADVLRRVEAARAEADVQTLLAASLDSAMAAVSLRIIEARRALEKSESSLAAAEAAVRSADGRVTDARRRLERHALAAYIGQGQLPALTASFTDQTAEAQVATRYAQVATDVREREIARYRGELDQMSELESGAVDAREDAEARRQALQEEAERLAEQQAAQESARQAAAEAVQREQVLAVDVATTKRRVKQRLDQVKAESAAMADLIRAKGSSSGKRSTPGDAATPLAVKPVKTAATPEPPAGPPTASRGAAATPTTATPTTAKPTPTTAKPTPTTAKPTPTTAKPTPTTAKPAVATTVETTTSAAPTTPAKPAAEPSTTVAKVTTTAAAKPTTTVAKVTTTKVIADEEGAVVTGKAPGPYSTGAPPPVATRLQYPIPGAPIVSRYGMRVQPVLGVYRMHEGIDIWAPAGTPILAAGSGTVIWAGPRGGYGIAVVIDHGGGLSTVYAHNSSLAVSSGDSVSQGQPISFVGATGLAGGPHLHLEIRIDGVAYDPLRFIQKS